MKPTTFSTLEHEASPISRPRRITEETRARMSYAWDVAWVVILIGTCGAGLAFLVLQSVWP